MNGWSKDAARNAEHLKYLSAASNFSTLAAEQLRALVEYSERQFQREIEEKWVPKSETKAVRLKDGTTWMNQRVEFLTTKWGRDYYWMRDGDNVTYLAKVGKNGLPDLS